MRAARPSTSWAGQASAFTSKSRLCLFLSSVLSLSDFLLLFVVLIVFATLEVDGVRTRVRAGAELACAMPQHRDCVFKPLRARNNEAIAPP